jgi:RHS repeat-associated protein
VATLLYDAWGNQRSASGATAPSYRFTGAELDSASGLYHMGTRFYDPTIGRWLSEDPSDAKPFDTQTLNKYTYINNDPLGSIDESGLAPEGGSGESQTTAKAAQSLWRQIWEAARKGQWDKVKELSVQLVDMLLRMADSDAAAQISSWVAGVAGTAAVVALGLGLVPLAAVLGGVAIAATAVNMIVTTAQWRAGKMPTSGFLVSQAFNMASLLLGAAGMGAKAFSAVMTTRQGATWAAAVVARPLSYGGIALAHYEWKQTGR